MNYSKNMKANKVMKKIIISWTIILIIGILIGMLIGKIFSKVEQGSMETLQQLSEFEPYGTIDGRSFNWGISEDWTSGAELGFTPLEVDLDEDIQEFIYCLSYGYSIDYEFVMGLIQTESTFNPSIVSSTNDYGLMQINKVNHGWLKEQLGITDFLDPYQNTRSGIFILRNLFEKYEDPAKVLMAYNMGEGGASKLWTKGIYETGYTKKVFNNIDQFKNYVSERNDDNE